MTYHISIDTDETTKEFHLHRLLQKIRIKCSSYNCKIIPSPNTPSTLTHEGIILYNSLYRNKQDTLGYDLVFWETSIYTDIQKYTDNNITPYYIRTINKHNPTPDINILITYNLQQTLQNMTLLQPAPDLAEKITRIIHTSLPTCKYCGRIITPTQTLKKYCNTHCRNRERQIQNQQARHTYYKKYKHLLSPEQKNSIGTSNLTSKPETDFQQEQKKIQQEKRRLGI